MSRIAAIPVALVINGQRKVFPVGAELPDLNEHDARELQASGALREDAQAAKEARAREAEQKAADARFQAARAAAQSAAQSTQPAPASGASEAKAPAPAARKR